MKVIKDILKCDEKLNNSYVALGTFDGIHRGHRKLIQGAVDKAKENNGISVVYTFLNHPLEVIFPDKKPKMINTTKEKLFILEELGVDYVVLQTFDNDFANITKEDFIDKILVEKLGAREIFIGFNYTFGQKGSGNTEFLKEYTHKMDIKINVIPPIECRGKILSSTVIRKLILDGKMAKANLFLGRPLLISGIVEHGKKLGRMLGFPTANLKIMNKIYPPFGIYGGTVKIEGEDIIHTAVINIGENPTLKPGELSVEVHILDFQGDLYGKRIYVNLEKHLRDEKKFDSIEELVKGIGNDVKRWRKFKRK
ncbi:bifunctional riboflavin kinase/FAD synthetase [Fusobacterium sp. IOR10]|uniref:bifunctional riboflavin kinase/FAD synthetase n=1 Tax=Fusobacterium sp. IOR10 TaxID=2665157 RepID=UPI0013D2AEEB|nr:bifunctional riboflavin kinase/FAD synthetase [Fusobacterium sp. IOR10]